MNAPYSNRLTLLLVALAIIVPVSIPLAWAAGVDPHVPPPASAVETCAADRVMAEYRAQYDRIAELRDVRIAIALQSGPATFATSIAQWDTAFKALETSRDRSMLRASRTDSLSACGT